MRTKRCWNPWRYKQHKPWLLTCHVVKPEANNMSYKMMTVCTIRILVIYALICIRIYSDIQCMVFNDNQNDHDICLKSRERIITITIVIRIRISHHHHHHHHHHQCSSTWTILVILSVLAVTFQLVSWRPKSYLLAKSSTRVKSRSHSSNVLI